MSPDVAGRLRSAGVGVDHGAAAHGERRQHGDAAQAAADRQPAGRQAVPDARRADGRRSSLFAAFMVFLDSARSRRRARRRRRPRPRCRCCRSGSRAAARSRRRASRRVRGGARTAASGSRPTSMRSLNGGTVRGVTLDVAQDDRRRSRLLDDVKQRWERVDAAADRLLDNETSLTSLAKGLEALNQGNNALLELAQQASAQIAAGRRQPARDRATRTSSRVLSQRIAKNANTLASADEIDPEVAFLLGKDAGTFRDICQRARSQGSEALRLAAVRERRGARDARRAAASASPTTKPASPRSCTNMPQLVVAKQAARGDQHRSRAAARRHDASSPTSYEGRARRARSTFWARDRVRLLALRLPACCSARCSSTTRACARCESERREQAQPGSDPAAAERDGQPRRRRPDGAGVGDRGRDRRDRRLDQLHDRGAAHAGARASTRRPTR